MQNAAMLLVKHSNLTDSTTPHTSVKTIACFCVERFCFMSMVLLL